MKPKHIFLIRHAESQSNFDSKIHAKIPNYKIELTEKGEEQAYNAGKKILETICFNDDGNSNPYAGKNLQIATYCSPFYRTRQTYINIKKWIGQFVTYEYEDPRLREQEYGHLRGPKEDAKIEKQRNEYGKFYFRIPDGESGADVYDRQKSFLGTLFRDFEKPDFPNVTLIVGHGFQLRIFLMTFLHWTVEEFEAKRNIKNCEILHLELQKNGKYKLLTPLENE